MTPGERIARYDGIADWYDRYLTSPFYDAVTQLVAALAGRGTGICVDHACGVGHHLPVLADLGWTTFGCDLSADMLRLAASREHRVIRCDAAALPLRDSSADLVVSSMAWTDFDDTAPVLTEIARVLRPGGRLVGIGVHPCFEGPHAQRLQDGTRMIHPGYRSTGRTFLAPGIGRGVRARVGVRHVPLAELLNNVIASGLHLDHVEEAAGDTPMVLAFVASRRPA